MERGEETGKRKARKPLGGCGHSPAESGCKPKPGQRLGVGGKGPAIAAPQHEGLGVGGRGAVPAAPFQDQRNSVRPWFLQQGPRGSVQGPRPALPRRPLALAFTEGCFHLTAQNESSVFAE